MSTLDFKYGSKTVQEFVWWFEQGKLNLEPAFQRNSVWSPRDRRKFIESIFQHYPVPSVFLYKRETTDGVEYDVLDGKQRLEAILAFLGLGRYRKDRFSIRTALDSEETETKRTQAKREDWDWQKLKRKGKGNLLTGYEMQTVEVSGDFSVIADLFVKINSTGRRLSGQEVRQAKSYASDFLKQAARLAKRRKTFFVGNRIVLPGQITRMKDVELICELMASIVDGGPINKKQALDKIINGRPLMDQQSVKKCVRECETCLNLVERVFPNLRATCFARPVDFYSLFLLVWEMKRAGSVLSDRTRNRQAQTLLRWLSSGVDRVREKQKRLEGVTADQEPFRDYLFTVRGDTDSLATRKRRADILRRFFGGLFEKKDEKRTFSIEQRRLIWNSDETHKCSECNQPLTWENFTIDHIKPHSRGGPTTLSNAALMCRECNSRKGAARRTKRRR